MRVWALGVVFSLGVLAGEARADVPPIDQCSAEGEACANAGNEGKTAGGCVKATCSRLDKSTGKSESYECLRCVEGAAPKAKKSKGCSTLPGAGAELDAVALLCAAGLFAFGRRARAR